MTQAFPLLVNKILIGADLIETGSGGTMEHRNPATGAINGTVILGGTEEVDRAVAVAKEAVLTWEALGPHERRNRLGRLAEVLEEWADDFRALSAAETAMPQQGFIWRLKLSAEWVRAYQGLADKVGGQLTSSTEAGALEYVRHEPYGVVGIIITWNSPLLSLCMKIPAALAAGNAVVVKPSELTPYTPILFGKACLAAGIPPGVVNIVPGGAAAGEALVVNEDVEKISFTGGLSTAARMMQSGAPLIKPFCFELGGKSAYMIFPDADVQQAASLAAKELSNAGQSCKFGSRIFIHESRYDEYKAALLAEISRITVGDPEDMATNMGPLITKAAQDRVLAFIRDAQDRGWGKLVTGGVVPNLSEGLQGGYYVAPTVFEDVDPSSPLGQEEIFGPVFSLIRFSDEKEAIRAVNSTNFGLANYIHTRDLRTATRVTAQVKSGTVYVNDANRRNPGSPFGGFRASGIGYEGGRAGLEEFLRKKTVGLV